MSTITSSRKFQCDYRLHGRSNSYVIMAYSEEEAEAKLLRSFPKCKHVRIREVNCSPIQSDREGDKPSPSIRRNRPTAPMPMRTQHENGVNDAAMASIVFGGIVFLLGAGVTIATYLLADGGGTFIVAWGAIVFGLFQMVRGFAGLRG